MRNKEEYLKNISYLFDIASTHYLPQKRIRYPQMNDKEFETIKNQKLTLKDFSPKNV